MSLLTMQLLRHSVRLMKPRLSTWERVHVLVKLNMSALLTEIYLLHEI